MKTKSGVLVINKTEVKELLVLIQHTLADLSYHVNGSYSNIDGEDVNKKEVAQAHRAIEMLRWIITEFGS